jgi:tetratricopeptide (TPR) repeat protein
MKRKTRNGLILIALLLLGIGAAVFLSVGRGVTGGRGSTRASAPPNIPTDGLDPAATALIEHQLDKVRAAPRSGAAWGQLGAILKSFGFREQAAHSLAEAERLNRKEPRWPYLQATLRLTDAPSVAEAKLRRTVALCGNNPEIPRLRLARLLAESGREDAARDELQQLLRANPNSGPARLLMAQINQSRGELQDAIALAKACTTNAYTVRSAWTLLSALQRRAGDTNAADIATRRAATAAPDAPWPDPFEDEVLAWRNDARSLSDRAQAHLMAGRPAQAVPLINRLTQEHPNFAETWLLLGRAQILQRQPAAAEQSLKRFLQMDPQSVNGHFQLGMSLLAQQRYDEAAATFQHATTLKRDFGPAFFNFGFALAKSGKPREAIAPFQEAIRQNPELIDAYILLADLHLQLNEKSEAIELATLAERLNPVDPRLPALRQKIEGK